MNPDVKKMWVEALRSGKYQQCTGKLHDYLDIEDSLVPESSKHSYCCLGVLCDLALKNGVDVQLQYRRVYEGMPESQSVYFYDDESGVLPESVMRWAGINEKNPDIYLGDIRAGIVQLMIDELGNDSDINEHSYQLISEINDLGIGFLDIADIIEKSL